MNNLTMLDNLQPEAYYCIHEDCQDEIDPRRYYLGYATCLPCGQKEALSVKHCVVPLNKSNYMLVTDRNTLKQLNPKRTT